MAAAAPSSLGFVSVLFLISVLAQISFSSAQLVLFSSLRKTLIVSASHPHRILKAGDDKITVRWGLNQTLLQSAGTDDTAYKTIKLKLCYAPISQVNRAWRKTEDELDVDKTCQFQILAKPFAKSANQTTFDWTITKDVPTATYFVRAYVYDGNDHALAFGQTTDKTKATNLFQVQAITGRHASVDIAAACFSAFSVLSLAVFFYNEKRKARQADQK